METPLRRPRSKAVNTSDHQGQGQSVPRGPRRLGTRKGREEGLCHPREGNTIDVLYRSLIVADLVTIGQPHGFAPGRVTFSLVDRVDSAGPTGPIQSRTGSLPPAKKARYVARMKKTRIKVMSKPTTMPGVQGWSGARGFILVVGELWKAVVPAQVHV